MLKEQTVQIKASKITLTHKVIKYASTTCKVTAGKEEHVNIIIHIIQKEQEIATHSQI